MAINKLPEFAKDGQKNTDDLVLTDGFPVSKKPARQWFNYLFNMLSLKINEIIESDPVTRSEIIDNLTTNDATKPLSAKQGKDLQDNKLGKSENAVSATDCSRQVIAGNGLSGGGLLNADRTLTLGTPTKITSSSTNSVTTTSHTHEIDKASTSVAGVVQLNNTLTSTSTTQALTAAQGKVLNDRAFGVGQSWQNVLASRVSGTTYTNTTSKTITVYVEISSADAETNTIQVDDIVLSSGDWGISGMRSVVSFPVPSGSTYKFTTANANSMIRSWSELR